MKAERTRRPQVMGWALVTLVALVLGVAAWAWQAREKESAGPGDRTIGNQHPANRLIHETSPYLLQHAHNPVDWYPWGPEAFAKAKQEGKPIFLSIGYSACHWCHVMERESFEDEGVARLLNDHFVSIKVDREERPDVDEIYMTAVQLMTGSGGWPMSTFLTPEGKPFFGGTYFPRDRFTELLQKLHEAWTDPERRKQIDQVANRAAQAIGRVAAQVPASGTVSPALLGPAVIEYLRDLDEAHGGFGGAPKFPPSMRLALMLAEHRQRSTLNSERSTSSVERRASSVAGLPPSQKKPDPKLLHAVTLTLDRMARGGIYDQIGGGFHRYSTDEKWLVPHFEKMLYDNALLSWVYLEAYRTTKNAYYRRIATETMDFVLRELHDAEGGLWSTLDADSEGEEGKFYVWTPSEVIAVLGKQDGALFNRIYDITPAGNFEGKNIPNLIAKPVEAWAGRGAALRAALGSGLRALGRDSGSSRARPPSAPRARSPEPRAPRSGSPAMLWSRLDRMRARLLAARERRVRPGLDDKVLTSWNGLMLRSLALGYDLTGEERYRQAAEKAASFLLATMRRDGRLQHSYHRGKTLPQAFLEDYSFLIVGLLELHRVTGAERWLKESEALARTMIADFWDEEGSTFFATPHHHEGGHGGPPLLARLKNAEDGATPSGQSMAALALIRLSRLTGDRDLRAKAQRLLNTYAGMMKQVPAAMPTMLLAAHQYLVRDAAPAIVQNTGQGREGRVRVTLAGIPASVRSGQTFEVAVRLAIPQGWHVNAARPTESWLIGTRVELAPGPFRLVSVTYPPPEPVRLGFSEKPIAVYTGSPTIRLRLQALPGVERAKTLRLRLRYQACNDRACQSPVEALLTGAIPSPRR